MTPEQQTLAAVAEALKALREEIADIKAEVTEAKSIVADVLTTTYEVGEVLNQTYHRVEGVGGLLGAIYQNTIPEDLRPPMTPGRRFVTSLLQNPAFVASLEHMGPAGATQHLESLIEAYDAAPQLTLVETEDPTT